MTLYDPRNDAEVVRRLERVLPDLIWLAGLGIQPTMSRDYLFVTAFGFGEHGNVHGFGPDVQSAVKTLRGAVMAEMLALADVA